MSWEAQGVIQWRCLDMPIIVKTETWYRAFWMSLMRMKKYEWENPHLSFHICSVITTNIVSGNKHFHIPGSILKEMETSVFLSIDRKFPLLPGPNKLHSANAAVWWHIQQVQIYSCYHESKWAFENMLTAAKLGSMFG